MDTTKRRGKPRGMRRDRDCRDCKARAVKCDLNRPRCLPCVQAGLPCGGYPQRVVWTAERAKRKATSPESRGAVESQTKALGWDGSSHSEVEQRPVFPQANSPGIDPSDTDKHSFLLRLASFCQHIKATHARDQNNSTYPTVEAVRLVSRLSDFMEARINDCPRPGTSPGEGSESMDVARHRLAALMELNGALKTASPFAILGIAAFAVFEVFDGAFGVWQRHIYGAKSLLDCHCRNLDELEQLSESVTGLTEVVARLIWFDTMGSIARGTTGLIFEDWHRQILNESFFRIVGCPTDTFDLFISVAKGDACSNPMDACFQAMNQLLKMSPGSSEWDLCSNMNRCGAVLAVLRKVGPEVKSSTRDATVLSAMDNMCRLISAIPPSSPFFIHMATSVYLAGINATTSQHCDVVRGYWSGCNSAGVPRYPDGLLRCEELWRMNGLE